MRRNKANKKVRDALQANSVYQWELADILEISEPTMVRKMRYEMPTEEQDALCEIIKKIALDRR